MKKPVNEQQLNNLAWKMTLKDIAFFITFVASLLLLVEGAKIFAEYLTGIGFNRTFANALSFGTTFITVIGSFFLKQHHLEQLKKG